MSLGDLIIQRIREHGPITVAQYMELALSHPELGYYRRKDPLGSGGDFTTAPEISQIFGELIGAWMAEQWMHLGMPEAALIELGPGRGTLMADLLRATTRVAGFHTSITVHMVETSPVLKHKQWHALAGKHPHIEWHDSLDDLPDVPWLVVANEFFDALPIRQFLRENGTWQERMITQEKGRLRFAAAPATMDMPVDAEFYECSEAAQTIARAIAAHIANQGGAALIADYGYVHGYADTLQAVKSHQHYDPLKTPGEADLTAHVDFSVLVKAARDAGLAAYGPVAQGAFLGKLGAIPRAVRLCENIPQEQQATVMAGLKRLLAPDEMGELFKVMCMVGKTHPTPEGFY